MTDAMAEHNSYNASYLINTTAGIKCGNLSLNDGSLRVPLATFYLLFFLVGLAGNLLALWVFLRIDSKKNSVRIFLINLAMADLLLMICLPFRVLYHVNNNYWSLHPVFCKVVGNAFYMNMYVSIILLGLISVDRYVKLNRVLNRHRFLSNKQSIVTCCLLWVTSIVCTIPMIASGGGHTSSTMCFQYKNLRHAKWKAYMNFAIVFVFWVVYGTLVATYGKIAIWLTHISKDKPNFPNAAKYKRTAQKSFFVLFLFTLCFVPYHFVRIFYIYSQITDTFCPWVPLLDKTNELSLVFSAFNSCLDPILYFVLCGSVRKTVLHVIHKHFCLKTPCGSSYDKGIGQREMVMHSDTSTL